MTLDDYPIDEDYIDVEKKRADVDVVEPNDEDEYKYDDSHRYNRDDDALFGTARDVEIDRREVSDHDRRGETRTGFYAGDAEGYLSEQVYRNGKYRSRAEWLRLLQHGFRDSRRKQENAIEDTRSYIETFTAILDMTTYQKERTEAIIKSIDMSHMAHSPRELIILATISVVANEDDRWVREEDAFVQLVTDLDGSMQGIKNARQLVKQKTDLL